MASATSPIYSRAPIARQPKWTGPMTPTEMQEHIATLCETNEIIVTYGAKRALGSYWLSEIHLPHVKSARSYATALHKIGHILGRHQRSSVILVRERWAWQWARRNAL